MQRLTSLETVRERTTWLFTARDRYGDPVELILVPCEDGVQAWSNRCMHEPQRLDRGDGAVVRGGEIVCPRHGSMFDVCSGDCDNGPATGTTLPAADVAVNRGDVYLVDEGFEFLHEGGIDDDRGPQSSSHLSF